MPLARARHKAWLFSGGEASARRDRDRPALRRCARASSGATTGGCGEASSEGPCPRTGTRRRDDPRQRVRADMRGRDVVPRALASRRRVALQGARVGWSRVAIADTSGAEVVARQARTRRLRRIPLEQHAVRGRAGSGVDLRSDVGERDDDPEGSQAVHGALRRAAWRVTLRCGAAILPVCGAASWPPS